MKPADSSLSADGDGRNTALALSEGRRLQAAEGRVRTGPLDRCHSGGVASAVEERPPEMADKEKDECHSWIRRDWGDPSNELAHGG